jgi:uncharacterized protein (TIGR02453 family)
MISKDTFQFLAQLKKNNYKEWFEENRPLYNRVRKEFESFIDLVINEIRLFDKDFGQTSAKASIFRINRDIRFSRDKLPYKTNFGAFMAKGGKKADRAGYYLHIEPQGCFLAGGIYMPSGPVLKAIRKEIYYNIDEFKSVLTAPEFIRHFGTNLWGEKLKTAPQGFPKDFPDIEYLNYKHYTLLKEEPDSLFQREALLDEIRDVFKAMMPFNRFLNHAIDDDH